MDTLFCPYFDLRPEGNHSFTLIPFQAKVECSEDCAVLASFLWREATGFLSSTPPSGQTQHWVRTTLLTYAPLFVRTLTTIPVDLIPPASHMSNIAMQIEGRIVAVDFKTNEAIFKLDNTSARKLEVFYSELTEKEPSRELIGKLDELRVRMAMADVIRYVLLDFHEVVGGLFDIDAHSTSVPLEVNREGDTISHDVQEEWSSFCKSLYGRGRPFSSAVYRADSDEWESLEVAVGDYSEDGQLEMYPQDVSTSPQPYWNPNDVTSTSPQPYWNLNDVTMSTAGCGDWSRMAQPEDREPIEPQASQIAITGPWNDSTPQFARGAPKLYGGIGYVKPARALRVPPTAPLVSCVDPTDSSIFTHTSLDFPASSFMERQSGAEFSNSSLLREIETLRVMPPEFNGNSEQAQIHKVLKLPQQSSSSSVDSEDEVMTPSNASADCDPFIYNSSSTSPTAPVVTRLPYANPPESTLLIFSPCSSMWLDGEYISDVQCKRSEKRHKNNEGKLPLEVIRGADNVQNIGFSNLQLKTEFAEQIDDELKEYGFQGEFEMGFTPLATRVEKALDPTNVIIQGKMEAMLKAAQSEGITYRATRDGLDNHPISVRLRSISGTHSSMRAILGEQTHNIAVDEKPRGVLEDWMESQYNEESVSRPSSQDEGSQIERVDPRENTLDTDCQSSSMGETYTRSSPKTVFHLNNHSVNSSHSTDDMQNNHQDFSDYKTAAKNPTERLKALKLRFEHEGEQMLASYHRTLRRIEILKAEIEKSEIMDLKILETQAREMIEYCGYDESAFTSEGVNNLAMQRGLKSKSVSNTCKYKCGSSNDIPPKEGYKEPLKIKTQFSPIEEVSPCCQSGPHTKGASVEESNNICAHGMMRTFKSLPCPKSAVTTPAQNTDLWRLNYTVGGNHCNRMNAHQDIYNDCKVSYAHGTLGYGESPVPAQHSSFSGADVTRPIDHLSPVISGSTTTQYSSGNEGLQSPMNGALQITKAYFERLRGFFDTGLNVEGELESSHITWGSPPGIENSYTRESNVTGYQQNCDILQAGFRCRQWEEGA